MKKSVLFTPATLARMGQVENRRAKFFQELADGQHVPTPFWLRALQRVGMGNNLSYSRQSAHATYLLAAASLREFQRCVEKWSTAQTPDHETELLKRLFSRVEIFADGTFDVTRESLPLYNAAVLDVAKFFVLEAQVMNTVLRTSNVGTRVERNDIVAALKDHWAEFRPPRKAAA